MKKVWKTVKFNKKYEVSNYGEVRNKRTGTVLKPWKLNDYTSLVFLSFKVRKGVHVNKSYGLHKLVSTHFQYHKLEQNSAINVDYNGSNNKLTNLLPSSSGQRSSYNSKHSRAKKKGKTHGVYKWKLADAKKKWRAMISDGMGKGKSSVKTIGYFRTRKEAMVAYRQAFYSMYGVDFDKFRESRI